MEYTIAPTFSDIVRTLPSGMGDQLRTLFTDAIQQEVAAVTRQALAQVGEIAAVQRQQEVMIQQQAVAMAGLDAKQEEHGQALLVMEANHDSLRDDLDTARETLRTTVNTVGEQARDWTDLRTFLAQQQAQSAQQFAQLARIEASQSHLQSMFKRRGADLDPEGPAPPPSPGTHTPN